MTIPLDEFFRGTRAAESAGNPNAVNPITQASGLYQFIPRTWAGVVRNYGNRYGIRADGIMDPAQQDLAIRAITENEYLPAVQRAGRQVTPAELYMPHLLGVPTYQRLATADPNARASDVIPNWNNVYSANRGVFRDADITAAQAIERIQGYYNRKAGGTGPRKAPEAPLPAPPPVASSPAPTVPASSTSPQPSLLTKILSALTRIFKSRKE